MYRSILARSAIIREVRGAAPRPRLVIIVPEGDNVLFNLCELRERDF